MSASRQRAYKRFTDRHQLACFRCGKDRAEWAKVGVNQRGPWAICVPCVQEREAVARSTS